MTPWKLWEHKDAPMQLGVNCGGVHSGGVDYPVLVWETMIEVPVKM